jgi:hypothetical protein
LLPLLSPSELLEGLMKHLAAEVLPTLACEVSRQLSELPAGAAASLLDRLSHDPQAVSTQGAQHGCTPLARLAHS